VAQARENPTLDHLHTNLDLGFVLRPPWPGRQDDGAEMFGAALGRKVGLRLVAVRVGDQRARIVRHDQLRNTAKKLQCLRQTA